MCQLYCGLATIDGTNVDVFNSNPVNAILHVISLEKQKYGLEVAQKVYDHYFDNKESNDIVIQYGELLSDFDVFKCVDESVKWLSQYSGSPFTITTTLIAVSIRSPKCVSHADELLLMFTSNLIPPMSDPNDIRASKMLLDLWTSFIAANRVPQSKEIIGHCLPTTQQKPR